MYLGGGSSIGTALAKTVNTVTKVSTKFIVWHGFSDITQLEEGITQPAGYTKVGETIISTDIMTSYEVPDEVSDQTVPSSEPCDHDFKWETVTEARGDEDAVIELKCSKCGEVRQKTTAPGTAMRFFLNNIIAKLNSAKKGSTIVVDAGRYLCLDEKTLKAVKDTGVNLELHYKYKNVRYQLTITPDYDFDNIRRDDGYYGFRYLDGIFHGQEEID